LESGSRRSRPPPRRARPTGTNLKFFLKKCVLLKKNC
jgi:hypothetical protein